MRYLVLDHDCIPGCLLCSKIPKPGDPCAVCDVPWSLDPGDVHSPLHYGKGAHRFVPTAPDGDGRKKQFLRGGK